MGKPDPFGLPVFAPFLAPVAAGAMLLAAAWFWAVGLKIIKVRDLSMTEIIVVRQLQKSYRVLERRAGLMGSVANLFAPRYREVQR